MIKNYSIENLAQNRQHLHKAVVSSSGFIPTIYTMEITLETLNYLRKILFIRDLFIIETGIGDMISLMYSKTLTGYVLIREYIFFIIWISLIISYIQMYSEKKWIWYRMYIINTIVVIWMKRICNLVTYCRKIWIKSIWDYILSYNILLWQRFYV